MFVVLLNKSLNTETPFVNFPYPDIDALCQVNNIKKTNCD